ncbi:MAG: hypothetical protein J7K73_03475 [Nanoarchaeota archaeon]|nr:hypothetical protein [Nanoarchaeota archaeon]
MDENEKKEIEIDFDKIFDFFKRNQKIITYILLILLLLGGFYSRTRDVPQLQHKYLISPDDPYVFLRYSTIVAEKGSLPANDTLRYYPEGFDTKRENAFTAYLAGYIYNFVHKLNPNVNMFDIAAYYAPSLFVIALIAFFFLSKELLNDEKIALISTGILAFSPAILLRTVGGFLEKEPLFLPLFMISMYLFIKAYKEKEQRKHYLLSIAAGIFTGLAAFSSGLFIFIVLYISLFLIFEVLFEKLDERKLKTFLVWLLFTYIFTSLLTLKYGGFLKFYKSIQFQIPIAAIVIGGVFVSFDKLSFMRKLKEKIKIIPTGITAILIGVAILLVGATILLGPSFVSDRINYMVGRLSTPLTLNVFGQTVSENQPPTFIGGGTSWWNVFGISIGMGNTYVSFGLVFLMFFTGAILLFRDKFKEIKYGNYLTWAFAIFTLALTFEHFTNDFKYAWVNTIFSPQIVYAGIFGAVLLAVLIANKKEELKKIDSMGLLLISWYLISIIATNGAVRLFFIMATPAAILAGYFIKWLIKWGGSHKENWVIVAAIVLSILVIVPSFFAVSTAVAHMNPGASLSKWYEATDWIKENTPQDSIFTHWWDYGYLIQTMANRPTVGDPGNFHVVRNYDIGGHVFNAFNYSEILWFTDKYHLTGKDVYFVIPSEDILKFVQIARLGSLSEGTHGREMTFSVYGLVRDQSVVPNNLKEYKEYPLLIIYHPLTGYPPIMKDFRVGSMMYNGEKTHLMSYIQPATQNTTGPLLAQIYDEVTRSMEVLPVECICVEHKGCFELNVTGVPTCALPVDGGIINIPYKSKDILFTQLFLLDRNISGFEKVYDNGYKLDVNTARGAGPIIRIYKYNWTALENEEGW